MTRSTRTDSACAGWRPPSCAATRCRCTSRSGRSAGRSRPASCWACSAWSWRSWWRSPFRAPRGSARTCWSPGRRARSTSSRTTRTGWCPSRTPFPDGSCSPPCGPLRCSRTRYSSTTGCSPARRGPRRPPSPERWARTRGRGSHPAWAVCDEVTPTGTPVGTTVLAGRVPGGGAEGVLIAVPGGDTWLVAGGHRHRVDLDDGPSRTALGLTGRVPRPASPGLVSALPEGAAVGDAGRAAGGRTGPARPGDAHRRRAREPARRRRPALSRRARRGPAGGRAARGGRAGRSVRPGGDGGRCRGRRGPARAAPRSTSPAGPPPHRYCANRPRRRRPAGPGPARPGGPGRRRAPRGRCRPPVPSSRSRARTVRERGWTPSRSGRAGRSERPPPACRRERARCGWSRRAGWRTGWPTRRRRRRWGSPTRLPLRRPCCGCSRWGRCWTSAWRPGRSTWRSWE